MPNPFRNSPAENWAQNFRDNVEGVEDFNDEATMEKYKRNVEEAFSRAGVNLDAEDDSKAVQAFSQVHNNGTYTTEAVKRLTVLAAAEYVDTVDQSEMDADFGDINTGQLAGVTDYDNANPDSLFEPATEVLGIKFVNNWAGAYQ